MLVYVVEAADLETARTALRRGDLPITAAWQRLVSDCSAGHPSHEVLFEHVAGAGAGA